MTWRSRPFGRPVRADLDASIPVRQGGPRRTLGMACGALLLGVVAFLPFVARPVDTQTYYLGFIVFLVTLLPIAVRLGAGDLDVFEPIILISLLIGLSFGIRSMYLVYEPTALLTVLTRVSFEEFIGRALLMTMAGYGALLVGYYVAAAPVARLLRNRRPTTKVAWPLEVHGTKVLTLLGVGVMATIVRAGSGELAGATGQPQVTSATFVLGMLSTCVEYGACILALHIAAGDDRRWLRLVLWFGVVPLAAVQALVFAGKGPLLLAFYSILAAWHYARRRLPVAMLAGAVAVAVLVVFPTVNAFRVPDVRSLTASSSNPTVGEFVSRVAAIPSLFAGMDAAEYARFAAESVVGRANGIDSLAVLMKYDGTLHLGDASAYWQIPLYAFVPRAIWPDKPVILTGTEFARLFVTPTEEGVREYPSIGVFHLGDLYASFGAGGVLIGMCALGILFRTIYHLFNPAGSRDLGRKFVYIVLLWSIVNGFESDIPTIYGNVLKSLVIWGLIKAWLNGRTERRTGGSGLDWIRPSVVASPYALARPGIGGRR